jgi:hydroxymethylpyrimidine pyrophosphatase-like HAD family hydrolase
MKVISFDLDGTIIKDDKRTKVADVMDELFEESYNFIVVYTARSYSIFHETRELLNKHNIKYHALVMEKIRADIYIDDKGIGYEESIVAELRNR